MTGFPENMSMTTSLHFKFPTGGRATPLPVFKRPPAHAFVRETPKPQADKVLLVTGEYDSEP